MWSEPGSQNKYRLGLHRDSHISNTQTFGSLFPVPPEVRVSETLLGPSPGFRTDTLVAVTKTHLSLGVESRGGTVSTADGRVDDDVFVYCRDYFLFSFIFTRISSVPGTLSPTLKESPTPKTSRRSTAISKPYTGLSPTPPDPTPPTGFCSLFL